MIVLVLVFHKGLYLVLFEINIIIKMTLYQKLKIQEYAEDIKLCRVVNNAKRQQITARRCK